MDVLSAKVIMEARRLGAVVHEGSSRPPTPRRAVQSCDGFASEAADFVRDFFGRIEWPDQFYCSKFADDPSPDLWDGLDGILFRYAPSFDPTLGDVSGCDGMLLCECGVVGGGDGILLLDQNDPNPSDPTVYRVGHYDPGQPIRDLGRLSALLAKLEIEGG